MDSLTKISYDRSNPLSFWINKSKGACQVKDLPTDERDRFVKEFQEKQDLISQHVVEFNFKSRKIATKLEDMTDLERQQWLIFLKHDNAEILDYLDEAEILEQFDGDVNFFDEEFEEYCGYNEELYIDTWEWNGLILTDIYGWPGDNQSGGVFIGFDLVFENSDTRVDFPRISDRYVRDENKKYPFLNQGKDTLSHLKGQLFSTESCNNHEHCNKQTLLSEK